MKLPRLFARSLALVVLTAAVAHAQGIGGSQSSSTGQNGVQSTPPTDSTPAEAQAKGTPEGTAPPTTTSSTTTSTAPATTTSSSTAAPSGQMETIVVTGAEGSVLPSDTTVTSVYGSNLSVQDTPRSVTAVSSELLKTANITSLGDFVKVAPSAYTLDQYGVANVPTIRGQYAEVYINGMQRTTRTDGPPTSFNSVDSAAVVNGPGTSVYGPTQNVGGYVDLVTKQPYFDGFHDDSEFTYGMWDEKKWTEDFGAPIIPGQLAYRVSYEGNYSGSYYDNELTNSNDGFAALTWTPSKDFKVEFNTEFYDARFSENIGWNRPTQGLIDDNQYVTGYTNTTEFGPNPPYPNSPNKTVNPVAGGTYGGLITGTGTTYLSPQTTEVTPNDSNYGKDLNGELALTYNVNPDFTIIDRTYYEYLESRDSAYSEYYTNFINNNQVQNRLEFHIDFDTPIGSAAPAPESKDMKDMKHMSEIDAPLDFKSSIITGLAFRWVDTLGYGDYFDEDLNAGNIATGSFPAETNQQTNGNVLYPVPGTSTLAPSGTATSFTNAETAYVASAFFQHQITFTPQWMLLYSGRLDTIFDRLSNPLPGAGVPAGIYENTVQSLPTADVSVDYKPVPWLTAYATFDWNESVAGTEDGGYASFANDQSPAYHYQNFLYEGGLKADVLNHSLFATVDGYYQTHNESELTGAEVQVRTLGVEVSTTYQPDRHFYINLDESYTNSYVVDPGGPDFTQNVYNAFATDSAGVSGAGGGAPTFAAYAPGHYQESGLPQFLFTGTANYKFDFGLGASIGYEITDPMATTLYANVWIPWQYQIDTSVFYNYKNYGFRLNFFNITNQENFSSGGFQSGSGGDLVTVKEPFHMEGTISYKF
jgi:hypothetical protein